MGQAADVRGDYEALRAALLEDGMRGPLAHLRLAEALGDGKRLRIQRISSPDTTPPEDRAPAFLERLDALRAEDAGWAQRVAEAEEAGIEDALAILDRRLRDAARRDLGLGPCHVLPPSLEAAAEAAGISVDVEPGEA